MAPINPKLMERLEQKLKVGRRRLNELILEISNSQLLEREAAALVLAANHNIPVHRFSTVEQRARMRGGNPPPSPRIVPVLPASPPSARSVKAGKKSVRRTDANSVFVVHGRDEELRKSIYSFLRSIGLKPLEWEHALLQAKDVNPQIEEVLDVSMARVQAVIILFSPDDDAMLNAKLWGKQESQSEKKLFGQPRPNVLFEAGMALARHPQKTLIVQVGKVRGFSDIAGRHVVRLTDAKEKRNDVINRLEKIGCKVDRQGTDWMSVGTFLSARDRKG